MYYERNMPIWSRGINRGYTGEGDLYNNPQYYDPYQYQLQQKRRMEYEENLRRLNEANKNAFNQLSSIVSADSPKKDSDEPSEDPIQKIEEENIRKHQELSKKMHYESVERSLSDIDPNYESPDYKERKMHMSKIAEKNEKLFDKDDDLFDFFERSGEIVQTYMIEETNRNAHNVNLLYNNAQYRNILNTSGNMYQYDPFSNQYNYNIDDEEIKLPKVLNDEYIRRKQQFLNSIIESSKV